MTTRAIYVSTILIKMEAKMFKSKTKNLKEFMERVSFVNQEDQNTREWGIDDCLILWNCLKNFTLPECDITKFDPIVDEHLLGLVITCKGTNGETVCLLQPKLLALNSLLRACYNRCSKMKSQRTEVLISSLGRCIFTTDELCCFEEQNPKIPEIENDQHDLNYCFFKNKVDDLAERLPDEFLYFITRLLNNCFIIQLECTSQNSAEQTQTSLMQ